MKPCVEGEAELVRWCVEHRQPMFGDATNCALEGIRRAVEDPALIVEFDGLDPATILIRRAAVLAAIEEASRG